MIFEHELSAPWTVLSELCSEDFLKVNQSDVSEKVVISPYGMNGGVAEKEVDVPPGTEGATPRTVWET